MGVLNLENHLRNSIIVPFIIKINNNYELQKLSF